MTGRLNVAGGAGLGKSAQLLDGTEHGALGNVGGNLHLADIAGEDEVDLSVESFLVAGQAAEDGLGACQRRDQTA